MMLRCKETAHKKFEKGCTKVLEKNKNFNCRVMQNNIDYSCPSSASGAGENENQKDWFLDLRSKTFYLVHVNWLCVVDNDIYYPAELALVEFSFESGIKSTYHTLINSGKPPVGFAYDIKTHCEQTHGIPKQIGEVDYSKILRIICKFLKKDEKSKELHPLYTMPDLAGHNFSIRAVKSTLLTLCDCAGCPDEYDKFQVCSLSELFFNMKNTCSMAFEGVYTFQKPQNAEVVLQEDTYTYSQMICCAFHHENGNMEYCSFALVKRWVYIMCENLCSDLQIKRLEGKHKPAQAVTRIFYNSFIATERRPRNDEHTTFATERRPRNDEHTTFRERSKKYNKVDELPSSTSLSATLNQLTVGKDSQHKSGDELPSSTSLSATLNRLTVGKDSQLKSMNEPLFVKETPKNAVDLSMNDSFEEPRKRTVADVVSGTKYHPQYSEHNFPAIGSQRAGRKPNRHSKW